MNELNYQAAKQEKRKEERKPDQMFVSIKPIDEIESAEEISLTIDKSETGAALIAQTPLPIGTRIEIRVGDDSIAIGEIVDWNWDSETNLVRFGVQLVENTGKWPQEQ